MCDEETAPRSCTCSPGWRGDSSVVTHANKGGSSIASETPTTLIRRFFDEVITKGDLAAAHEILTTDFILDGPAGVHGPVNFVQFTGILRDALAARFTVEVMIADGDRLACLSTMYGTHQGEFRGVPASGRRIAIPRIDTFSIAGGKIREVWTTLDYRTLMQHLES
jgi:predicted SnoaL-like aldol condensation-catalyzing enzyme